MYYGFISFNFEFNRIVNTLIIPKTAFMHGELSKKHILQSYGKKLFISEIISYKI